ncbi:NADH-ubiquinone oxidoreductase-F iron-sulfur binding region domain-containing protein [Mycolicibacterium sp. lyk4-40-TYG-92]|uniref:NADH-ubiquinone oxidoreductase-F iron-sulfur binding region domain-containing protein n=1 Tax=Mycolicibacterium sp. lyk4-40-TYG-92 TaxID=3040295 RepID=UPI00254A6CA6|nr:NADH-ubiquinone oxidoreductase-F iron-sulfur binding region domain-containing protein [Mycolicibacterium sp. lyk4-40-TYG-92]
MPVSLTVAAWPGLIPRLLRDGGETYHDYVAAGGYRDLADPQHLLDQVERSGLRGRGGAAFPMAVKLRSVRAGGSDRGGAVVVANGEEGEPASIKDRWLLRNRPHLVLDGLRLAATIVGAQRTYVYVSDPAAAASVEAAVAQRNPRSAVEVVTVAPGYVAGEETAAVRAINGGPAKPTDKPPRPFEQGVGALPTLVSNVETLANLPYIHAHGGADFKAIGTAASPGTFLATITGTGRSPALYELPHGVRFADMLEFHGVPAEMATGALMGGYFAGLLGPGVRDATLDHDTLRQLGSGLGCGAISILNGDCPVAVAASVLAYFDRENAGQCGSCFNGTAAMAAAAAGLRDGVATGDDIARLRRWSRELRGRGACATLDGAANMAASLLGHFPDDVVRHLENGCPACQSGEFITMRPYEVEAVMTA